MEHPALQSESYRVGPEVGRLGQRWALRGMCSQKIVGPTRDFWAKPVAFALRGRRPRAAARGRAPGGRSCARRTAPRAGCCPSCWPRWGAAPAWGGEQNGCLISRMGRELERVGSSVGRRALYRGPPCTEARRKVPGGFDHTAPRPAPILRPRPSSYAAAQTSAISVAMGGTESLRRTLLYFISIFHTDIVGCV